MPNLSIMIKPASSACNMKCEYCFYCDEIKYRDVKNFGMIDEKTTEQLIIKAMELSNGDSIAFAFQGGEPTLRGLDYFRFFVDTVKKYNKKYCQIFYSLQTNGLLIDEEWCRFLRQNEFLVGLSLDGTRDDNIYRLDKEGKETFDRIINATRLFNKYGVAFNILTVVTKKVAANIDGIYDFYKSMGFKYLQFIPCIRNFDSENYNKSIPNSQSNAKKDKVELALDKDIYMDQKEYSEFLSRLFSRYIKDYTDGDYTSIRMFDNFVALYKGEKAEQCGMEGHCTYQFVVEGNGNVYPCDFYCLDKYLLGNIKSMSLKEMADSDRAKSFILESLEREPRCERCAYFKICRGGGCKRNKQAYDYCEAYKDFFDKNLHLFRVFYLL